MADAMKKVSTGDPLRIPAQAYNAFIDAARDFQQRTSGISQQVTPGYRSTGIILVKNASGENADRCAALGLDSPLFGPSDNLDEFKNRFCLSAVSLTSDHKGKFCILLQPLAAGAIGLACVAGVCPAQVNITEAKHSCADISDEGEVASCPDGSAQILWKESDTGGSVWCVLRLGADALGTHDSLLVLDGTGATADTRTWDATNPPEGNDGVQYQPARLYWSGNVGDPVKLFIRRSTFDSTGRLVLVGAEEATMIATGDCNT